jgi:DNA-binding MarR family transcriptional regulator
LISAVAPAPARDMADRATVIEEILDQLEPLIARQRRAVARQGCLRAISSTQLHVLFVLECDGPLPMSHLADLLGVSLPNVTGIVDRMVEHGLVERRRDADDRRLVVVSSTAAGRAAAEEIDLVRREQLSKVLERMTEDQLERTLHTFSDLRTALESADQENQGDS